MRENNKTSTYGQVCINHIIEPFLTVNLFQVSRKFIFELQFACLNWVDMPHSFSPSTWEVEAGGWISEFQTSLVYGVACQSSSTETPCIENPTNQQTNQPLTSTYELYTHLYSNNEYLSSINLKTELLKLTTLSSHQTFSYAFLGKNCFHWHQCLGAVLLVLTSSWFFWGTCMFIPLSLYLRVSHSTLVAFIFATFFVNCIIHRTNFTILSIILFWRVPLISLGTCYIDQADFELATIFLTLQC